MLIGALATVAIVLAWVTHGLLIGKSVAIDEDNARVVEIAESVDDVVRVTQVLSVHLGPDAIVLAMKIAFTPGTTVERVEDATNEMEKRIRGDLPRMRKIFIEVDSRGDGRGLEKK